MLLKNCKFFQPEPHLEPNRAFEDNFFSENSFLLTVLAKQLFVDVWQGSKYASGTSVVSEIMLAIDDFSLNSSFA